MLFIAAIIGIIIAVGMLVTQGKTSTRQIPASTLGIVIFVATLIGLSQLFVVIPAGHVGIIDTFGIVSNNTLKSGINLKNPLARIVPLSVKTQELKENMDIPSKEGLTINLEASMLFHLDPNKANEIYKTVGENYVEILMTPQFRSIVRGVSSLYEAKALYTSERDSVAKLLLVDLEKALTPRGIFIESVPLRKMTLPPALHDAIEQKLSMEQESQKMDFVISKERKEAERKTIEAEGISNFQKIVSQGINEQLLRWKGIEATEKLASSSNSKIVVIGGKDGMPLILNQ